MQWRGIWTRNRFRRLAGVAVAATVGIAGIAVAPTAAQAAGGRVAIVDQRHGAIKIFSLSDADWSSGRPLWTWQPGNVGGWTNLSDVKFRSYGGRGVVLVAASGGNVGTVDYKSKRLTWSAKPGENPHAIELLPTGGVVVASSGGHLFAYGKGGKAKSDTETFPDAHGVLWDPNLRRLWAFGGTRLCSYRIGGSATRPTFTDRSCWSRPPTGQRFTGGHDLSRVYGTQTVLWLSTRQHVYRYDYNTNSLTAAPRDSDSPRIKSVGNQPGGGLIVETQVFHNNQSDNTWGNGNVWLYNANGSYYGHRFVRGATIYKARPVVWESR
jgi:hypothetical protein